MIVRRTGYAPDTIDAIRRALVGERRGGPQDRRGGDHETIELRCGPFRCELDENVPDNALIAVSVDGFGRRKIDGMITNIGTGEDES